MTYKNISVKTSLRTNSKIEAFAFSSRCWRLANKNEAQLKSEHKNPYFEARIVFNTMPNSSLPSILIGYS